MSAHLFFQVIDSGAERRDEFGQAPNQDRFANALARVDVIGRVLLVRRG